MKVPEDATLCPNCEEALEPAQYAGDARSDDADEAPERTDVGPAPQAPSSIEAARLARSRATGKKAPAPAPAPPVAPIKPLRPMPEVRRPYLADAPEADAPAPIDEARKSVDELGAFFSSLTFPDRAAAGAALALLALQILPWRYTKVDDDESIGIIAAFPATILAVGVALLVYFRARRANAAVAATLQLAQVGAALVLTLFCFWFLHAVTDERVLHQAGHGVISVLSKPMWPADWGTGCAVIALVASVATAVTNRRL